MYRELIQLSKINSNAPLKKKKKPIKKKACPFSSMRWPSSRLRDADLYEDPSGQDHYP